ncbi:unnamed protein product [Orchesella dallaii]|uniref:BPTI/Kunitz inhibitor domain-containing protein n=1 Tax=Orchesella dallaii TaxID=48710 RepID=A0ABP1PPB6_9HEXA
MKLLYLTFTVLLYWSPAQSDFLEKVCKLPMDVGSSCPESKAQLQFYFDTVEERCKAFLYKGCDGNANRFTLQDDCVDSCQSDWFHKKKKNGKKIPSLDSDEDDLPLGIDCDSPPDSGPCKGIIPQWYFNKKSKKCETFSYGGCNGNRNRYNSKCQCETSCAK